MFLMEPYEAIESAFLYRRLPEAAQQSLALSRQAYNIDHGTDESDPNQADTDSLRQLIQKLMNEAARPGKFNAAKR
jgi:hypothetical protein